MKHIVIGAHLQRDDVEPLADVLPAGELFLSAVAVPDEQPLGNRDLLLRIAGVRGRLLDRATFIAIRYGFTAAGAREAESKVAANLPRWKRVLQRNRANVEMTLKAAATAAMPRPRRSDYTDGALYLKALHAAAQSVAIDPLLRQAIERTLLPLAAAHRWSTRDEKSAELSLLIARTAVDDVLAAGEKLRETRAPFLLSGPWPLEVFADDDYE